MGRKDHHMRGRTSAVAIVQLLFLPVQIHEAQFCLAPIGVAGPHLLISRVGDKRWKALSSEWQPRGP